MKETLAPKRFLTTVSCLGSERAGMSAVYLAQDTKLDRKVALKVLPADIASNNDRMGRFVRGGKVSRCAAWR